MTQVKIISAPVSDVAKEMRKNFKELMNLARRPETINGKPLIIPHQLARVYLELTPPTYKKRLRERRIEPQKVDTIWGITINDLIKLGVDFDY